MSLKEHAKWKADTLAECFAIEECNAKHMLECLEDKWPHNWATIAAPEKIDAVLKTLGALFAQIEHGKRKNAKYETTRPTA